MPARDIVSSNVILLKYPRMGDFFWVDESRVIFYMMPKKSSIFWNGVLVAYVQNGQIEDASRLFYLKSDWAVVSWNCLMGGCVRKKRVTYLMECP